MKFYYTVVIVCCVLITQCTFIPGYNPLDVLEGDRTITSITGKTNISIDTYEPDESSVKAISAYTGSTFSRSLNTGVDADWFKIYLSSGIKYSFKTYPQTGKLQVNTVIELYSTSQTLNASDDDTYDGKYSLINGWSCTDSGYYYIRVKGVSGAIGYYNFVALNGIYR